MSNRSNKRSIQVDGRPAVGAIEAARILSKKAKEKGIDRTYSRDSIYKRYKDGSLKAAMEAPAGNLYFVEDIEAIEIKPQVGKKSTRTEEERRSWYRKEEREKRLKTRDENA